MKESPYIRIAIAGAMLLLTACASISPYQINMMPAPDIYTEGVIDPFTDTNPITAIPYSGILYATDREPATAEHNEVYYRNQRGHVLRLGVGRVAIGRQGMTWEEARRITLLKNRTDKYPIRVTGVDEIGVLDRSLTVFMEPGMLPEEPSRPAKQFAALVNEKLAISKRKHIYIYVHGYKVNFENPLLVATELWHFLGYDGVFIAYTWPATPSRWAYASDLETAAYSARNLRLFLEYLAAETQAERIHLIGYSAGTRLVANAVAQLALENRHQRTQAVRMALRIGHMILVGSDFDRDIFGGFLEDGLLKVPETLTIYVSETDKALGMSAWLFSRQRLGQLWANGRMRSGVADYLRRTEGLHVIDVTGSENAAVGNGHAYFRQSPG